MQTNLQDQNFRDVVLIAQVLSPVTSISSAEFAQTIIECVELGGYMRLDLIGINVGAVRKKMNTILGANYLFDVPDLKVFETALFDELREMVEAAK